MKSSLRLSLPLQSSAQSSSSGFSQSQSASGGLARRRRSGGLDKDKDKQATPSKVTTLEHMLRAQQGGADTFCGQSARSSHSSVQAMSKSMSGARSLLDSRMSQQEAGDNVASSGDNGLGSGKYGQFSALKQQKQKSRNPEKRNNSISSAPEQQDMGFGSLEEYPEALRKEIAELQHALIEKFRGSNNKMVSGAQFRSAGPGHHKCETCESKDASLKKAKETIRSLRFQLSQTEEKLFSKTGGGRHNNGHNSAREQQGHLAEDWASIRDRNEELLARVSGLEHSNQDLRHQLESERRRRDLGFTGGEEDETTRHLREQYQDMERQYRKMSDASIENEKMMIQLKDQLKLKCAYAKDLEDEIATQKKAREMDPPAPKLQELEEKLEQAEETAKILRKERDITRKQYTDQVSEAETRNAEMERLNQLQHDQLNEVANMKAKIVKMESIVLESEEVATRSRDDAASAQNLLDELRSEIEALRTKLAEKDKRVSDLESDLVSVRNDADSANSRMNAMVRQMTTESENSAKAVQKAISSSVRLCVVAPTVNVHVADKKMKFRSNIPKDELEVFLRDQVLSKYTFLFEQSKENAAPDGTTNLQPWIKKVLAEMQESVENHITSAMKNGH